MHVSYLIFQNLQRQTKQMVSLLLASDVSGRSSNFEVKFPSGIPTLDALRQQAMVIFGRDDPRFAVRNLQVYSSDRWMDLISQNQLRDGIQVFAVGGSPLRSTIVSAPVVTPTPTPVPATIPTTHVIPLGRDSQVPLKEKADTVFREFDKNKDQVIDSVELMNGCEILNIGFSSATLMDLFRKGDRNRDSVIDVSEWNRFCEMYPALIDAFYHRIQAFKDSRSRDDAIEMARRHLDDLIALQKQRHLDWLAAQQACDAASQRLATQEASFAAALEICRSAEAAHAEAVAATEAARKVFDQLAADRNMQLAREQRSADVLQQASTDVIVKVDTATACRNAVAAAQESEIRHQTLLVESQKATEIASRTAADIRCELGDSRNRQQAAYLAMAETQREAQLAAERLSRSEAHLSQKQISEQESALHLSSVEQSVEAAALARNADQQSLQLLLNSEQLTHDSILNVQSDIKVLQARLLELEAHNLSFNKTRRSIEESERPLLEQEISLRYERSSLEVQEVALRDEQHLFVAKTTGGSLQRSIPSIVSPPGLVNTPRHAVTHHLDSLRNASHHAVLEESAAHKRTDYYRNSAAADHIAAQHLEDQAALERHFDAAPPLSPRVPINEVHHSRIRDVDLSMIAHPETPRSIAAATSLQTHRRIEEMRALRATDLRRDVSLGQSTTLGQSAETARRLEEIRATRQFPITVEDVRSSHRPIQNDIPSRVEDIRLRMGLPNRQVEVPLQQIKHRSPYREMSRIEEIRAARQPIETHHHYQSDISHAAQVAYIEGSSSRARF